MTTYPLTPMQAFRLEYSRWARDNGHSIPHEFDTVAWRVGASFDPVALESALQMLAGRHDALTASYHTSDSTSVQRFDPMALPVAEHIQVDGAGQESASLDASVSEWARTRPPLSQAPALAAAVFHQGGGPQALALRFPWLMTDHWGYDVMVRDLCDAYDACSRGSAWEAPEPAPFSAFVRAVADDRENGTWQTSLDYWLSQYQGESPIPALRVPTMGGDPSLSREGAVLRQQLPTASLQALREGWSELRAAAVTPYSYMLACLLITLRRVTGQDRLGVCVPAANRADWRFHDTVGVFSSVITPRFHPADEMSFRNLCETIRDTLQEGMEHQRVTYHELIRLLEPHRWARPSDDPVCYFDYWVDAPQDTLTLGGEPLVPVEIPQPSLAGSGIALSMTEDPAGEVSYSFSYLRRLLDDSGARAFMAGVLKVGELAAAEIDCSVGSLVHHPGLASSSLNPEHAQ